MKKIFNRTTALLLLCIINIVIIVILLSYEGNHNNGKVYEYDSVENYDYDEYLTLEKRLIEVEKRSFNKYKGWECDIYNPFPLSYIHYEADSITDSVVLFNKVTTDTLLGKKSNVDVFPSHNGKIVNIQLDESIYDITIYAETELRIDIYLDTQDYFYGDMTNTKEMIFEVGEGNKYKLAFLGFDYYEGFVDGYIKATYRIIDLNQTLVSGLVGRVKILDSVESDLLCISNEYNSCVALTNTTQTFLVKNKETGKYSQIEVLVKKTIGGYYIIETNSLNEGDTIYAI